MSMYIALNMLGYNSSFDSKRIQILCLLTNQMTDDSVLITPQIIC